MFCRMYPVVPLNGRVIADKDVMIGEYHFSKNVSHLYFMFLFSTCFVFPCIETASNHKEKFLICG